MEKQDKKQKAAPGRVVTPLPPVRTNPSTYPFRVNPFRLYPFRVNPFRDPPRQQPEDEREPPPEKES